MGDWVPVVAGLDHVNLIAERLVPPLRVLDLRQLFGHQARLHRFLGCRDTFDLAPDEAAPLDAVTYETLTGRPLALPPSSTYQSAHHEPEQGRYDGKQGVGQHPVETR